jgi:hypothetical protein
MSPDLTVNLVVHEIIKEVTRARKLHKGINSLHESYSVILEELEEYWELVKINPRKLSEIEQQKRMEEIHGELIQTAAMCVRSLLDLNL